MLLNAGEGLQQQPQNGRARAQIGGAQHSGSDPLCCATWPPRTASGRCAPRRWRPRARARRTRRPAGRRIAAAGEHQRARRGVDERDERHLGPGVVAGDDRGRGVDALAAADQVQPLLELVAMCGLTGGRWPSSSTSSQKSRQIAGPGRLLDEHLAVEVGRAGSSCGARAGGGRGRHDDPLLGEQRREHRGRARRAAGRGTRGRRGARAGPRAISVKSSARISTRTSGWRPPKRASSGASTPPGAGPSEPITSAPVSPRASARRA